MKNSNASKTLHFGNGQIKVLYIAGPTRSGSTILSNILGQISGFFHAGEVIEAWDRGRLWKCSCGQLPQECPVWSEIFMTLDAAFDAHDRAAIIRKRDRLSRSHKVILNHYLGLDHSSGNQQESKYFQSLAKLYAVIKTQTQADVIIDSSKNAGYAHSLLNVSNIDLHVVHLVRDSRATAFSWSKKKQELWKANPLRTSMEWSSRNLALEVMRKNQKDKYLKLRYEDFIMKPQKAILEILDFLKIDRKDLPFISSHEVIIESSHGLCGNPGRYSHGVETLRPDNRWRQMRKRDNLVATILTWPFLLKYHYQLY